jgi:pSer/pThr/pTyr-binding forkhead associated (FHA) protein
MNPRLVAISGPQSGTTFPLSGEEMIIGRDSSNWICITDPSSSRKHCMFSRNGDELVVKDLESRNGTFVNGIPIRERILKQADRIDVGDSSFLYLLQDDKTAASPYGLSDLGVLSTTRLRIEDTTYLHPQKLLSATSLTERIAGGLETVLEFSRAVQSSRDAEALQQKLLESVLLNTPADRASVSLFDGETNEIISVCVRHKNLQESEFPLSRTVLRLVVQDRSALLSNDILQDPTLAESSNSLMSAKVNSLIAVPLIASDRISGILYYGCQ